MTLTRDFKETVVARVKRDPEFAKALMGEAATLFLSGEPDSARLILRDLVPRQRDNRFGESGLLGLPL